MSGGGLGSEAANAQAQGAPSPTPEAQLWEQNSAPLESSGPEFASSLPAGVEEAGGFWPDALAAEVAGEQPASSGDPGDGAIDAAGEAIAGEEAMEGDGNAGAGSSKRDYVRWAPEEEAAFFEALRGVAGQKPEKCLKEIVARVGTKDYAQVRHYYYRLIKRLNKILGTEQRLDIKNPLQVHRAMAKFWDVAQQKGMRGTNMTGIQKKPRKQRELSTTVQKGVKAVMQRTSAKAVAAAAAAAAEKADKAAKAAGISSGVRKRKQNAAEGGGMKAASPAAAVDAVQAAPPATEQAQGGADVEMVDAAPPPPAKLQRRVGGPSTRQQQLLALADAAAVVGTACEGSGSRSQVGAHEGAAADEQLLTAQHQPEVQQDVKQGKQQHAMQQPEVMREQQPTSSSQSAGSRRQDVGQPPRASVGHSMRSSGSNGAASGAGLDCSMGQVGGKLRLQLMPLDGATAQAMAAAGHHPFLELTLGVTKSLLGVLRHLGTKWQAAATAAAGSGVGAAALFVHPPSDCPITLRGVCWGGPDCDSQLKMGDIYNTLHCPSPFQLLYSWGRPVSATPAAAATASAGTANKPASSRATMQRQQSAAAAAKKERLTAELREAISAAAAEAADPTPGGGQRPQRQQQQLAPSQQPVEQQQAVQGVQQPVGGFVDLLYSEGDVVPMAAMPAPACTPVTAARGFAFTQHQQQAVAAAGMPTPRFDQQPPAAVALQAFEAAAQAAAPPVTAERQRRGIAAVAMHGGGDSSPGRAAGDAAEEEGPVPMTDPRRPRGLLGLLQTPAEKGAKPKKQAPQRKAPASSSRAKASSKKGGKKQAAAAVPMPAALGPFMWAHMHTTPQPQQHALAPQAVPPLQPQQLPGAVPVLQQQPPMLQPQVAVLQQPLQQPLQQQPLHPAAAMAGVTLQAAGELDFGGGGDTLLQFFDAAAAAAGFSTMPLFEGSPNKVEQATDVPPLPGSGGDFSLKSWPSLSPPPNFQLPDGFETGLSPVRKASATLTGVGKAPPQGAAPPSRSVPLGPTDFSQLIAGFGSNGAATAPPKQPGAAVAPAAASHPLQQQQQQQQGMPGLGLPQDTLFGGFSLFGPPPPAGQAGQDAKAAADMPCGAGLAPLPDQELAELTFDFGSLLGVEDAPPSWMGGPGLHVQQQLQQQQQQARPQVQQQQPQPQQRAAPPVGDRPFAALFGK